MTKITTTTSFHSGLICLYFDYNGIKLLFDDAIFVIGTWITCFDSMQFCVMNTATQKQMIVFPNFWKFYWVGRVRRENVDGSCTGGTS